MDKEELKQLYWNEELTLKEIGKRIGRSITQTHRYFIAFGIPRRSMSEITKGEKHPNYGKNLSKETRGKISEAVKGERNSQYGKMGYWHNKNRTDETRRKLSESLKGVKNPNYGKNFSEETRRKMGKAKKGQIPWSKGRTLPPLSDETRKKLSETNKGKVLSLETRIKMSKFQKKRYKIKPSPRGDKHWCWRGGVSYEPYSPEFNEHLKNEIRERDNYACQTASCGKYGKTVHHIDYNKKNNEPSNLVTLCTFCHSKTNYNRKEWIKYFNNEDLAEDTPFVVEVLENPWSKKPGDSI